MAETERIGLRPVPTDCISTVFSTAFVFSGHMIAYAKFLQWLKMHQNAKVYAKIENSEKWILFFMGLNILYFIFVFAFNG